MLERKWAVLAKIETTYGTDPTPTTSDLINTGIPSITPALKQLERNHPMSGFGKTKRVNIGETVKVAFSCELETDWDSSADTPPSIGTLLRACNFTQTINTATSIVYANNSSIDGESITLYVYKDGLLRKISGCRGTVKSSSKAGEKVVFDFEFTGLYVDGYASDATFPTFTLSLSDAVIYRKAEIAIGAYSSPIIENLSWDVGNNIVMRPSANANTGIYAVYVDNMAPSVDVDPEVVALSSFNPFTLLEANTLINVSTVYKNPSDDAVKCTLAINDLQYNDVGDGSPRNNIMAYAIKLESGSDADVTFTFV